MLPQFQHDNLSALAKVLEDLPKHKREEHFNMSYYIRSGADRVGPWDSLEEAKNTIEVRPCETSACAAGWGIVAGIGVEGFHETIDQYVSRVFTSTKIHAYNWLFDASWRSRDNSSLGAAARIRLFLFTDGEIPNDWFYEGYADAIAPYLLKPIEEREPVEEIA